MFFVHKEATPAWAIVLQSKKKSIKTDKNKQPKRLASVHNSLQREAPASYVTRHNSTFTHVWQFPETSDNKSL